MGFGEKISKVYPGSYILILLFSSASGKTMDRGCFWYPEEVGVKKTRACVEWQQFFSSEHLLCHSSRKHKPGIVLTWMTNLTSYCVDNSPQVHQCYMILFYLYNLTFQNVSVFSDMRQVLTEHTSLICKTLSLSDNW